MKGSIKIILLAIVLHAVPGIADRLYGLERMERLDLLPYLLEGTQVRQVSSHDRSGGNDDGFNGTYSYLYIDENSEYVLFDEIGAGCVYRFWMTYATNYMPVEYDQLRIRFYYDNEQVPRLDLSIDEFFDGIGAPLESPLVGREFQSSHGYYCYVPFPYRERLRITLNGLPYFYNITYHRYDSPDGIHSWTGNEDQPNVMAQWNMAGSDPKPAISNLVVAGDLPIAADVTGTLFSVEGAGLIQSIKLDPTPNTYRILSTVRLQMNWDGGVPEVDVPLGDFFGSGTNELNMTSLPIGMKTSGDWYCYFPMPYWQSAQIQLVNNSGEALTSLPFEIQYSTNAYDHAKAGYFHAVFHEETFVSNASDFNFIDETGRGHVVGLSLFMHGAGTDGWYGMGYLEGDERVQIDGNRSPCIYGTGNEDYFNAGWYFNQGLFSLPFHGCTYKLHRNPPNNYTQAYRFHLSDIIPFNRSVRFGIEHGSSNSQPGTFSSITYYYKMQAEESGMIMTADLDLGDMWAEALYDYQHPAGGTTVSNTWKYEGDNDDIVIEDAGYAFSNALTAFTVPLIDGADGLLLRRRCDQGFAGQKANVYVDDVYAGIWYEADHNFSGVDKRWLDSEFMIPSNLVSGKTAVTISIEPLTQPWNEYHYWAYCIKPFGFIDDSDNDRLPDDYEIDTVNTLAVLDGAIDSDGDGFSDLDEYIAGTHPTNSGSYFMIHPDYSFASLVGRLYQVQECTNLLSNVWATVRSGIPGTGSNISLPINPTKPTAYHRLQVELP